MSAIQVAGLSFRYGDHCALDGVDLAIDTGQIFALLGPNGSGKTTLFRILCTLLRPQSGRVMVMGHDVLTEQAQVRSSIGIVFQAPSLDKKLTVIENIQCQAALYGLRGQSLQERISELAEQLGISSRINEFAETLSGGLRRRVELAKGMIHHPRLLLLDEPSTGLDPGARADLWQYLQRLRDELQITVVLTTHLLEEADKADRIAILNHGKTVVTGAPQELREKAGSTTIAIECDDPRRLAEELSIQFHLQADIVDRELRLPAETELDLVGKLLQVFGQEIRSIRIGRPTLEDVFVLHTGHHFWRDSEVAP